MIGDRSPREYKVCSSFASRDMMLCSLPFDMTASRGSWGLSLPLMKYSSRCKRCCRFSRVVTANSWVSRVS